MNASVRIVLESEKSVHHTAQRVHKQVQVQAGVTMLTTYCVARTANVGQINGVTELVPEQIPIKVAVRFPGTCAGTRRRHQSPNARQRTIGKLTT